MKALIELIARPSAKQRLRDAKYTRGKGGRPKPRPKRRELDTARREKMKGLSPGCPPGEKMVFGKCR